MLLSSKIRTIPHKDNIANISINRDPMSRLHYYLQLRENILRFGQPLSEDRAVLLASLGLQSDLGDFSLEKHQGQHYNLGAYIPQWVRSYLINISMS